MRFENAVTTNSRRQPAFLGSDISVYGSSRPEEEKLNETSWKRRQWRVLEFACLGSLSLLISYRVLQGKNKDFQNLYANLLFLLIVSLTEFACFCQRCFHLAQKWNLTADLLVTQDRLWKPQHPTDCQINWQIKQQA